LVAGRAHNDAKPEQTTAKQYEVQTVAAAEAVLADLESKIKRKVRKAEFAKTGRSMT
jgi:hypothetical protein